MTLRRKAIDGFQVSHKGKELTIGDIVYKVVAKMFAKKEVEGVNDGFMFPPGTVFPTVESEDIQTAVEGLLESKLLESLHFSKTSWRPLLT